MPLRGGDVRRSGIVVDISMLFPLFHNRQLANAQQIHVLKRVTRRCITLHLYLGERIYSMNHTYFARSIAAAAVVGMLAVSAPAYAQTTQTPPTNPSPTSSQGQTTTTTQPAQGQQPMDQTSKGPATPSQCAAATPPDNAGDNSSKGNKPIESSGASSNAPSGPTTSSAGTSSTTNPDCPAAGTTSGQGSVTSGGYHHTPSAQPATTTTTPTTTTPSTNSSNMNSTSMPMTSGQSTMRNTLRDNPNGSSWLQKFNRRPRTHAVGTTTHPPKP